MRIFLYLFSILTLFSLQAKPRVLSTLPSFTEAMFFLESEDLLQGVSDYCNYPEEAKEIDRFGSSLNLNLEKVVKSKVDTVLLAGTSKDSLKSDLEKLGIRVISPPYLSLKDSVEMLRVLNKELKLGKDKKIDQFDLKMSASLKPLGNKKRVLVTIDEIFKNGRLSEVRAVGKGSYLEEIATHLGMTNVLKRSGFPMLSQENLIRLNFDYIIRVSATKLTNKEDWKNTLFSKKVRFIEKDYSVILGPRTYQLITDFKEVLND